MKTQKPAKPDGRGAQDDLLRVMETYGLTLPRNAQEWRVAYGPKGEPVRGELVGILVGEVRVLCTDGLLAYFLLGDGETVVYGHLANLVVRKVPREARGGASKPRARKSVAMALDFLNEQVSKL